MNNRPTRCSWTVLRWDRARFFMEDTGTTAIEYAIIAALVALVILGSLTTMGENVSAMFDTMLAAMTN